MPVDVYVDRIRRVGLDYHVDVEGHYYSAPHRLLRQQAEVRLTAGTVELFHKGERVAVHIRGGLRGRHTTLPEHLPQAHRRHAEWTIERIRSGWVNPPRKYWLKIPQPSVIARARGRAPGQAAQRRPHRRRMAISRSGGFSASAFEEIDLSTDRIGREAAAIGPATAALTALILESRPHPEHARCRPRPPRGSRNMPVRRRPYTWRRSRHAA